MKWSIWFVAAAGLVAIWAMAWTLKSAARERQATAAGIARMVTESPLEGMPEAERAGHLERLAETVNRLPFEERRQLALERVLDDTFEGMTEPERRVFLDRTLPQGFNQILEVFNAMGPEERRAAVQRALDDLQRADALARGADWSRTQARIADGTLQMVVEQGFESYLKTASAETKLDLAPVIEQIQQNVRAFEHP